MAFNYLDFIVKALNTSDSNFECVLVHTFNRFLFALSQQRGNHAHGVYILFFGHFHYQFEVLSGDYFELMLEVKLTKVVESNENEAIARLFKALEQNSVLWREQELLTFLQELEGFEV